MKDIVLLDGGLGQETFLRSNKPASPLWGAQVMIDEPEIVKQAQKDFITAGARVITTNSYTCTPTRLARDADESLFEELQIKSFDLANAARTELGFTAEEVQIAASIPPLIGSYTSDKRSFQELKDEYKRIVDIQNSRADLFIIETISVIREAEAAVEAALEGDRPILLSLTLSDENPLTLRSGEKVEDAITALKGYPIQGFLFNCSYPESITKSMNYLKQQNLPYGGYANGFTTVEPLKPGGTVDKLEARKDLDAQNHAKQVLGWVEGGATIVGGCCEVGPDEIAELKNQLVEKGYSITNLKSVSQ